MDNIYDMIARIACNNWSIGNEVRWLGNEIKFAYLREGGESI